MTVLIVGPPETAVAVRDQLAQQGCTDVALAPEADPAAEAAAVVLIDGGADESLRSVRRGLEAFGRKGTATFVLLHEGRAPAVAGQLLEQGAGDVIIWPRDAAWLEPRLTAMLRRGSPVPWPTTVDSELRLLHTITMAITQAENFPSAMGAVLTAICEATGWVLGQAWVRRMGSTQLECSPAWHARARGLEAFRAATESMTFEMGVGVPGEVWASHQRSWLKDVSVDSRFRRATAARQAGLKAGFFVPVIADGQVVAVLEFFVFEKRAEDARLLPLVSALALQLGSIIERKRIEEAYRLLTTAVQQMGEAIVITTAATTTAPPSIIFANAAFTAMTGYSNDEVVGRTAQLLFASSPDLEIDRRLWTAIADGNTLHGETVGRRKDGTEFDLDWRIAPVRDKSGVQYLIANLRDITDRKRVERTRARLERALNKAAVEWRETFDAIDFPIFILDERGRIRRLNRTAQQISGRSFQDNLGTRIESVATGEPWRRAGDLISTLVGETAAEVLQADSDGCTWEIGARRFRAQANGMMRERDGGEEREQLILLIARDISPTIRLQDSLRRSQTMAAMGSLVAGVAHEVRNPLFGISATLDAFEARFGSQPGYRSYTSVLRGEVTRLSELMRDLLEYGKHSSDERALGRINDVVAQACSGCAAIAERKEVGLHTAVTIGLPRVPMDFGRLVQVFQNLIENGIQHSPAGGSVTVRAAVEQGELGPLLVCSVEDDGPGFRPDDVPRVFEPFFTRRRGGTGLGLSIVQRILEQHGGAATVGNRPEGGGRVTITLPMTAGALEDTHRAA